MQLCPYEPVLALIKYPFGREPPLLFVQKILLVQKCQHGHLYSLQYYVYKYLCAPLLQIQRMLTVKGIQKIRARPTGRFTKCSRQGDMTTIIAGIIVARRRSLPSNIQSHQNDGLG
jgi:hypothetical protein